MNTDGSNVRLIIENVVNVAPTWLRDGQHIAYLRNEQDFPVYVINIEDNNQYKMTDTRFMLFPPTWSPDGQWIAFLSPDLQLYVMSSHGTNLRQLTHNEAVVSPLTWSSNGRQIAFASLTDGNQELYIIDVDGENLRRLTWSNERDSVPAWRPS
jgi:TolB protein